MKVNVKKSVTGHSYYPFGDLSSVDMFFQMSLAPAFPCISTV